MRGFGWLAWGPIKSIGMASIGVMGIATGYRFDQSAVIVRHLPAVLIAQEETTRSSNSMDHGPTMEGFLFLFFDYEPQVNSGRGNSSPAQRGATRNVHA